MASLNQVQRARRGKITMVTTIDFRFDANCSLLYFYLPESSSHKKKKSKEKDRSRNEVSETFV
jgi:hypothetical protein